jgi:hypothetical protein
MYRSALHVQPDETDAASEPIPMAGQGRMPCTIAVVSDGRQRPHPSRSGRRGRVGRARPAPLGGADPPVHRPGRPAGVPGTTQNAEDLSAALRGLPPDIGAVFLIYTDPAHHWATTGSEQAGGSERPVITARVMTAVAATAALLTTLRRRGALARPQPGRDQRRGDHAHPPPAAVGRWIQLCH